MKKLYSKILSIAILFFSYAQAVFAGDFDTEPGIGIAYGTIGCSPTDLKTELIGAWSSHSGFLLFLLVASFCSFLFYFRLRKKNTSKIILLFLFILGVFCLLLTVFGYFIFFSRIRSGVGCI